MVGTLPLVGSSILDSPPYTCPFLCLDALPSSNMNLKNGGEVCLSRNSVGRKQFVKQTGSLELSSSFVDSGKALSCGVNRCRKKQRKVRSLVIVSEVAGQYDDSFEDVKTQIFNYFTYKAVRTVLNQLYEMNPTQYKWFYDFVVTNNPGEGKRFIRTLGKEKHELAERVMVTRLHLYGKWVKKCNHAEMYKEISDENLELMRQRLMETVIWPTDDTNTEKIG
ncbi:hypothetical protein Nepgr_009447 [Nepenthes gracilis]|uniref:Chaperonin-like RbcX protein n=1 Tax=Nepenthes gracilis TaxID=150966 RepID=A0AAD3SBE4_NEPGR|nr:hypothetical protein Nepgr_009447 [Nepenthes gracilis]